MKIKTLLALGVSTIIFSIFTPINSYNSTNVSANTTTKAKIDSILKGLWTTKLEKYNHPVKIGPDQIPTYYHAYGFSKKYSTRVSNVYFNKNKKPVTYVMNDQNGYGKFKYTKLGKNYYMITTLGVGYSGTNLQHKYVIGYSLFIKMHGKNKMTLSQRYTGTGKTYEYDYQKPHTYYRR